MKIAFVFFFKVKIISLKATTETRLQFEIETIPPT